MESLTLFALTTALLNALSFLAGSAANRGVELLAETGADQAKAREELRDALQAALNELASDPQRYTAWYTAFSKLHENKELVEQVAVATVAMVQPDPARVKADMLEALNLPAEERPHLANFLFQFREKLSGASQFQARIQYANQLYQAGQLDKVLAEATRLASTIKDTAEGPAFRVQIVSPPLEAAYLEKLAERFRHLDLFGRDPNALSEPINLNRIYIALDTTRSRLFEPKPKKPGGVVLEKSTNVPESALRVVFTEPRLVLLGEPGSGKSTFVQHLCLNLAQARRDLAGWAEQLKAGPEKDPDIWAEPYPLPVFVRLRELARNSTILPLDEPGHYKHLLNFIAHDLKETLGDAEYISVVREAARKGEALVVLDGLDEVTHPQADTHPDPVYADEQRRIQIVEAIHSFAREFRSARVVVTCRTQVYPKSEQTQWYVQFPVSNLSEFTRKQIGNFIENWFKEMKAANRLAGEPQEYIEHLNQALESREQLDELAQQPFLLTQMALLVGTKKKLPNDRAELYSECVKYLLWEWEDIRAAQTQREPSETYVKNLNPSLKRGELEKALEASALHGFLQGLGELPEALIKANLSRNIHAACDLSETKADYVASQFISQWLADRNGLFRLSGERQYGFPHRTFYEFLAARCLVNNSDPDNFDRWDERLPELAKANPSHWREVMRFAASLRRNPREVVDALEVLYPPEFWTEANAIDANLLVGQVIADAGKDVIVRVPRGKRVYESLEPRLIHIMRDTDPTSGIYPHDKAYNPPRIPIQSRGQAANLLEAFSWEPKGDNNDLYHFIQIPYPPSAVNRPQSFFIAKYPVTNAQYARFVIADDYAKPEIWRSLKAYDHEQKTEVPMGDKAWEWFNKNDGPRRRPRFWDDKRFGQHRRLAPVVGVTWYEAAAYCEWLTRHWREFDEAKNLAPLIPNPQSLIFRLPLENEWVQAAGGEGPRVKIKDGDDEQEISVRYPWQAPEATEQPSADEILARANVEGKLGSTSPVCMYPAGASQPHGLMDMAGNVWEWQLNYSDKDHKYLRFRGGAWSFYQRSARVAEWSNDLPGGVWDDFGFRVVGVAPVSR